MHSTAPAASARVADRAPRRSSRRPGRRRPRARSPRRRAPRSSIAPRRRCRVHRCRPAPLAWASGSSSRSSLVECVDRATSQAGQLAEPVGHLGAARSSATTTSRVSSPATVPRTPVRPARSRAEPDDVRRARRRAQHDEVARVRDLDDPVAEHPAQVVLGRALLLREIGDGVDALATAGPHLDGAQVFEVARHGGLGGDHARRRRAARRAGPGS